MSMSVRGNRMHGVFESRLQVRDRPLQPGRHRQRLVRRSRRVPRRRHRAPGVPSQAPQLAG
jgi:hypothetical protein